MPETLRPFLRPSRPFLQAPAATCPLSASVSVTVLHPPSPQCHAGVVLLRLSARADSGPLPASISWSEEQTRHLALQGGFVNSKRQHEQSTLPDNYFYNSILSHNHDGAAPIRWLLLSARHSVKSFACIISFIHFTSEGTRSGSFSGLPCVTQPLNGGAGIQAQVWFQRLW